MTGKTKRAQYTLEFKLEAVRLVKAGLKGLAAPQLQFGPQYTGGAEQMFVLKPCKYGSLR